MIKYEMIAYMWKFNEYQIFEELRACKSTRTISCIIKKNHRNRQVITLSEVIINENVAVMIQKTRCI